ncbi:hypothetical protein L486_04554 [Kwoniella mangroviensis CBS 10435]|uniref:C2 NT-type domain-containing protein n=1 Tax=Kwoniella mangroviensis CBS 10435 TaxID=1331196 RepID=A0A1B9ISL2_9TREE|nr:hypothetical protein L486_04554 [Kwoniella mangroviensis CBS 10435]
MATSSLLRPSLGITDQSQSGSSSPSSSFFPPPASISRSSTPNPITFPTSLTSSSQNLPSQPSRSQSQHHHPGISSKLKHMFDNQKHAIFETTVVIHELGNVPQLSGEFDVQWKFRGKKPRPKEMLELTKNGHAPLAKPSLPNLKLQSQNMQASSSTASVGTTSTASSGAYPPTPRSMVTPSTSAAPSRPLKSLSMPPPKDGSERPDKRGSEPTPLKQVIAPDTPSPEFQSDTLPTESPQQMTDEPEAFEDDDDDGPRSRSTSKSSERSESSSGKAGLPPLINIHRPIMTSSSRPSETSSGMSTPTDRLAVPSPVPVPVRGGTIPSYSTLIDPMANIGEPSRRGMNRAISMATTNTSSSTSASTTGPARPFPSRVRSLSGPGIRKNNHNGHRQNNDGVQSDWFSEMRKGTTPARSLKSHSVEWDYELHHVSRVPISKSLQPATTPTSTTPTSSTDPYRQKSSPGQLLPYLGEGPLSESGLRLVIEQLPFPSHSHKSQNSHLINDSSSVHSHGSRELHTDIMRKESKEKTVFGIVDIDLAAFAGKGKMTRRFLLKGSRTNATIKLSVDMRWIGGEAKWAAPPMQEGHHVSGVHDFMPDTEGAMRSDLGLVKTPSNSSSGSSMGLELQRSRTTYSTVSSNYQTRNGSATDLGRSITNHSYQSYENHLAPSISRRSTKINDSPKKELKPLSSIQPGSGRQSPAPLPAPSPQYVSKPLEPSPVILNISKAHDGHKHHTHHLRRHGHAQHHGHGHHGGHGISDLPPEVIIEAIFNPHPASVNGPFTYVPQNKGFDLENEKQVLEKVIKQASSSSNNGSMTGTNTGDGTGTGTGGNTPENVIDLTESQPQDSASATGRHKLGWRAMRVRAKAEREQKEKEKSIRNRKRTDSSGL